MSNDPPRKVVKTFERKRVLRRPVVARTARLVRRAPFPVDRVLDLLVEIRDRNQGIVVAASQRESWRKPVERLILELRGDHPTQRVLRVVEWYADQPGWRVDPLIPRVDSGKALREKFGRLEDCMVVRTRSSQPVSGVIAGLFNGSRVLAEAFEVDVLGRAGEIDFGQVTESELAGALGLFYREVVASRSGADLAGLPGPLDVVRRYVNWLGEKTDWRMTTRVLSASSPAFQQWRREEASLHPRGVDPLTGGS